MNVRKLPIILLLTVLTVMAVTMISGCGQGGIGDASGFMGKNRLHLEAKDYPRVDGSTATIPLSEAFAAAVMGVDLEEARQYVEHNKTHEAYVNLIDGKADIIFVTSPSEEELSYAREKNVELSVVPVVSEGFVFLTNSENLIKGLTLQQIKDIYTGKTTNWSEVGGSSKEIIAYQRPENSGSQTGMLDLVMNGEKLMSPPMEQVVAEMGMLVDQVAVYNNEEEAIGYSYYYYVTDMWQNKNVKLLEVDGVYPDKTTISDGSYPVRTAYYAVLRADEPKGSNAKRLLKWILSDEGQRIAEEVGYVRLGKN
ncbi:MAG: uncharacterized protein K0Q48_600 [Bacillota bacterium]|nr:uncharacterized protein [Bacillota bacterium]